MSRPGGGPVALGAAGTGRADQAVALARVRATRHHEGVTDTPVVDSEGRQSPLAAWSSRRLAVAIAVAAAVIVAVGAVVAAISWLPGQPQTWLQCAAEGRDGWTVEHPPSSVSEAEFRGVVRDQTDCVGVEVFLVNTDTVAEGHTVRPIGTRSWVGYGGSVEVLIEAEPGPGVVECGQPLGEPSPPAATAILGCDLTPPPDLPR